MLPRKCSLCGEVQREGLIWTSLAWYRSDGVRTAYKHKLCLACAAAKVAPVQTACEQPTFICPGCGIDTTDDFDAIYGKFFIRGSDPFSFEAPFCAACAAHYRAWFMPGAEQLVDRDTVQRPSDEAAGRPSTVYERLFGKAPGDAA